MEIGRIIGPAPSNYKHAALKGLKLVMVDVEGAENKSGTVIAWDRVDAGPGDRVLLIREGGAALRLLGREAAPVRTVVVAQVDTVNERK